MTNQDLISRQAVLDATVKKNSIWNKVTNSKGENLEEIILQIPLVNLQEPKTGHWIRQTDDYHDYYECEHCGIAVGLDDIKNYCPNCGCRMVEPQERSEKNR